MDLFELGKALWYALQALGRAIIGIMEWAIGLLGIPIPFWVPQLAAIIIMILLVLRYGKYTSKLLLIVLLLLIASVLFAALFP